MIGPGRADLDHTPNREFGDKANRLLAAASEYVLGGTPRACRHDPGDWRWVVCAQHPAAGLFCHRCAETHGAGHPHAAERLCDGPCGRPAPLSMPALALLIGCPAKVRQPGGVAGNASGVVVVGLRLCPACCANAGITWDDRWVA